MKSKQISFFLLPDDYVSITEFVGKQGILISALPLKEKSMRVVPAIENNGIDWLRVVLFKNTTAVHIKTLDSKVEKDAKVYSVDTIESSVVEFDKSFYVNEKKQLRGGRIYFVTHFYVDNKLIQKDAAFLEWADGLMKYLKKSLNKLNEGKFKGAYASAQVMEMVSKGELQLIE